MQKGEYNLRFFGETPEQKFEKTPSLFWSEVYNDWSLENPPPPGKERAPGASSGGGSRPFGEKTFAGIIRQSREDCVCFN